MHGHSFALMFDVADDVDNLINEYLDQGHFVMLPSALDEEGGYMREQEDGVIYFPESWPLSNGSFLDRQVRDATLRAYESAENALAAGGNVGIPLESICFSLPTDRHLSPLQARVHATIRGFWAIHCKQQPDESFLATFRNPALSDMVQKGFGGIDDLNDQGLTPSADQMQVWSKLLRRINPV